MIADSKGLFCHAQSQLSYAQRCICPGGIYALKVNNRNTGTNCKICTTLTIKTPERRHRTMPLQSF